jgi:hypothetical protein
MKWKDDFIEHLNSAESISMGLHTWQGSPFEKQSLQRDWDEVRFKVNGNEYYLLKEGELYTFGSKVAYFTSNQVEGLFRDNIWIELKDEPTTIHVERPKTLEDRITKIEEQLKLIFNGNWNADNIVC